MTYFSIVKGAKEHWNISPWNADAGWCLAIDQSNLPINSLKSVVANEYNPLEP
jgi:hypothetical protein